MTVGTTIYDDLELWHITVVCTNGHARPHIVRQFVKDPQRETLWRALDVETAQARRDAERYYAWRDGGCDPHEFLEAKRRGEPWVHGPSAGNVAMAPVSVTDAGRVVPTVPDDVPPVAVSGGVSHVTTATAAEAGVHRKHVLRCDRCPRSRAASVEVGEELLSRALDSLHDDGTQEVTPEEVARRVNRMKQAQ